MTGSATAAWLGFLGLTTRGYGKPASLLWHQNKCSMSLCVLTHVNVLPAQRAARPPLRPSRVEGGPAVALHGVIAA
jgi:hypothetical protein